MGDLVQYVMGTPPKIRVEWGWVRSTVKPAIPVSPKRCKIGPRLLYDGLFLGSRIRAFDWCQNHAMTLNGRNVRHPCRNKILYRARHKNSNECRFTLSSAKCRPVILVARNTKCMRMFAGFPSDIEEASNANFEHEFSGRTAITAWRIYTKHMATCRCDFASC